MTTTYNGWTNYQTWKTHLELIDGYDVNDFMNDGVFVFPDDRDEAVDKLASHFETYVEDCTGIIYEAFTNGIVQDFIARVNFTEIAEHYVDDYMLELQYEEMHRMGAPIVEDSDAVTGTI